MAQIRLNEDGLKRIISETIIRMLKESSQNGTDFDSIQTHYRLISEKLERKAQYALQLGEFYKHLSEMFYQELTKIGLDIMSTKTDIDNAGYINIIFVTNGFNNVEIPENYLEDDIRYSMNNYLADIVYDMERFDKKIPNYCERIEMGVINQNSIKLTITPIDEFNI